MLRRIELAQRIRDMYFADGSMVPQLRFTATPLDMDRETTRFALEIDGTTLDYRFGPERGYTVTWPGPKPGAAAATFEEKGGGRPAVVMQGPWAWQKLVDAAALQQESDDRYVLTWRRGDHYAIVRIDAVSIRNPFNKQDLQQFTCG
jgi:type VI secretion system protein ImpL